MCSEVYRSPMTNSSEDSGVDDNKGWSFDHIKDDTEDAEDLPEDEDGTSSTEDISDHEKTVNPWLLLGILSPLLGIVLFFSEEILGRQLISASVAISFVYLAYLVSLLLLLIDIRGVKTKRTQRIGKGTIVVATVSILGLTHAFALTWYGSLTTTVIGWYFPVWVLSVLMIVSYVALRFDHLLKLSQRDADVDDYGNRASSSLWLAGVLSPLLFLTVEIPFLSEYLLDYSPISPLKAAVYLHVTVPISMVSLTIDSRKIGDEKVEKAAHGALLWLGLELGWLLPLYGFTLLGSPEGPGVVIALIVAGVSFLLVFVSLYKLVLYVQERQNALRRTEATRNTRS